MTDLSQVTEDSARGGFFLFSGATLASIILAVSAIIMGRFLGPELYGQYNLVLVIPTLLVLLTDLGMNAGITKFVAGLRAEGKEERVHSIIRYTFLFRITIGVIISLVSFVFANYFALFINRPDFGFYIQLASLSVIFQVIFTTSNSAFVGLDKSQYSALNSTVRAVLTTILQLALVLLSYSITGALVGFVGGFIISSIFGSILLILKLSTLKKFKENKPKKDAVHIFSLLTKYGLPVYVSVVLIGFFPLYQQMILAFFSSDITIGNFRAAYNFVILLTIVSTSFTTALLPAFSKLEYAKPEVLSIFFNNANKYTTLIIVPITVSVILFSSPIVSLLYGSTYTSAPVLLSLYCSIFLLSIIGSLTLTSVFNGLGKTRYTMIMTLINFIILIVLTPVLAFISDVVGVIIAYLIATIVASLYAVLIAIKKLKIKFDFRSTLNIYFISVLSAIPTLSLLLLTDLNSALLLIIGVLIYLCIFITLMPLMKIVNKTELETLTRMSKRLPLAKIIAEHVFNYQRKILLLLENLKKE